MIPEDFKDFFVNSSSSTQKEIVRQLLNYSTFPLKCEDVMNVPITECPHCRSNRIRANGKLKGVQRYFCNACGKNFSQTTGKFWYNLKKRDKVERYLLCLLSGYSIRKSAKETGISVQTSFNWRHKLLTSFSNIWANEFESNDWLFIYSEKTNKNFEKRLRKFMTSFSGKATKYLQNYLNWFLVLEKIKSRNENKCIHL